LESQQPSLAIQGKEGHVQPHEGVLALRCMMKTDFILPCYTMGLANYGKCSALEEDFRHYQEVIHMTTTSYLYMWAQTPQEGSNCLVLHMKWQCKDNCFHCMTLFMCRMTSALQVRPDGQQWGIIT